MSGRFGAGSLRLNLIAWLVAPGLVVLAVSAWLSYNSAFRLSTLVTDRQLTSSARVIAEQIGYSGGKLVAVIPPAALELFATDSHDEVAYAVMDPYGGLVAGYPGLDAPETLPVSDDGQRYFETMFRTEAMRATMLRQPVITPQGTVVATVIVGETQKARHELIQSLWLRGFVEQALVVLAGAVFIWIGISRQLRPLLRLRQEVLDRPADRFEPFDPLPVQSEIRPLVVALNSHMDRLRLQLERQRRFLDSAAHQLRTPLAIMKTQVGYALRTREAAEVGLALREVDGNLTSMARLTNQLLTLGSVEHDRQIAPPEVIQLNAAVRQAVMEAAGRALDNGIELAFDADSDTPILASAVLVKEVVANLLDNVIHHAGSGTTATVAVRRSVNDVLLRVEDDGRGVAAEERPTLLERFRRGRTAGPGGSGLGLSIVAEIAESLGGAVELPMPRGGRGFCVVVRLPIARSEVASAMLPGEAGDS